MQRICSYCSLDLGEKCGACGSLRVVNLGRPENFADSLPDLYECLRCHRTWLRGTDPITHGVCDPYCPKAVAAITAYKGELKPLVTR
jgi:hypothetical protein